MLAEHRQSLEEIAEYIRSDCYRSTGKYDVHSILKALLFNRSVKYCFWFRLCRARFFLLRFIAKRMHNFLSDKYSIQIQWDTKIGYGLFLGHHMCVVVNHSAELGDNVNLSQFTTIGANEGRAALVGSNVYIGPGVSIVGNLKIGEGATIGAGAVVTRNVAACHTAVGSPAKGSTSKEPRKYIQNPWPPNDYKAN
ncbi:MAG: serine acetyltransferase [Pseudomonadota bacterium]